MTTWIEPPPKKRGCLGKGCLLIVALLVLLIAAFFVGSYVGIRYIVTSPKPRELPRIETSEGEQNAVQARWDYFEAASRNRQEIILSEPALSPAPDATPVSANRIELTADDINQFIARNRKLRGKAFVSIDDNVGRIQVSIPLERLGFRGRYLNGEFTVRASTDRDPRKIQVTQVSLSGGSASEAVLKALLGTHSVRSYVDEFANKYGITSFTVEDNKAIIDSNGGR
ncbi:MAG: hypothetical protein M3N12_06315 [Verrucomicrobiota bacterium]|nr:hypothetical protein [Verrucomicrobiota bacterium]